MWAGDSDTGEDARGDLHVNSHGIFEICTVTPCHTLVRNSAELCLDLHLAFQEQRPEHTDILPRRFAKAKSR